MYTSSSQLRVRYIETDQMGVVYHGHFFQYFESARAECIRELGITYADMEKSGIIMPVVEVQCKYLRPAIYDDLLTVKVILKELPLHHKVEFFHEVTNEKGELLVTGKVVLYFMHAAGMGRAKMPEELRLKLQPYFS